MSEQTRIVIAARGWVWVGKYEEHSNGVVLDKARNIRRWGTTAGLSQLRGGPLDSTTLDAGGQIHIPKPAVVATIVCDNAAWDEHLLEEKINPLNNRDEQVRILIASRGWVWVGEFQEDPQNGLNTVLRRSRNIRRWGTTAGLSQLIHGPTEETTLDEGGEIHIPRGSVVASIVCDAPAWESHLEPVN